MPHTKQRRNFGKGAGTARYYGKGSTRFGIVAVCTATVAALFLLPGSGAALAAGAGSLLGGPVQAVRAVERLAQQPEAPSQSGQTVQIPQSESLPVAAGSTAASQSEAAAPEAASVSAPVVSPGGVNDSYVLDEIAAPAGAGTIVEKYYTQTPGGIYTACGAGTIRNNTPTSAAEIESAVAEGLPFSIDLGSTEPQVLILHTHATETYRTHTGLWFAPDDTARSTDIAVNMCAVGTVMADTLNEAGICTLHDTTLNDYPSYTGSYANSRAVAQNYLAQYPSIKVILDVHRDAIESGGARYAPVCTVNGRQAAQVMLICGCNNGTTVNIPNCHQNLRFAAAWQQQMESSYPGFTRPVLYSYRFYNQDLSTGALLIEVGGHGNNLDEAMYAGRLAALALAATFGA